MIPQKILSGIRKFSPGYFAMVMATGIVSVAAEIFKFKYFGQLLFYLNIFLFLLFLLLVFLKILLYPKDIKVDFQKTSTSPTFLTFVAASNVLGFQFIVYQGNYRVAGLFLILGVLSWLLILYALLSQVIVQRLKPGFGRSINGTWLLIVVATESVAVLSSALVGHENLNPRLVLFVSLFSFLVGCVWYLIIITLIFYRLAFFRLRSIDLIPAYWINMGAVAIITLAGTSILSQTAHWSFLIEIKPFLYGITLLFWAYGTWWIPLIVILGIWRYVIRKMPIRYGVGYWSMVFPLGMYTVCTHKLVEVYDFNFLSFIPQVFVFLAILAWTWTMLGWVMAIAKD